MNMDYYSRIVGGAHRQKKSILRWISRWKNVEKCSPIRPFTHLLCVVRVCFKRMYDKNVSLFVCESKAATHDCCVICEFHVFRKFSIVTAASWTFNEQYQTKRNHIISPYKTVITFFHNKKLSNEHLCDSTVKRK